MSTPTAFEQYTVELINQARLNPHGEYSRLVTNAPANVQNALTFFSVNLSTLATQFAALTPVAPVAWNSALGDAAQTHTDLMLAKDEQSHQLPGEAGLVARIQAAGYANLSAAGEDVFAFADDAFFAHAAFFIDWGGSAATGGIQNPPGHRNSIMSSNFTEVGVGHVAGTGSGAGPGPTTGPNLVTHDFGNRFDYTSQVTGVIFNDADGNAFYGMTEGVAGATISSGGTTANGFSSGGYNLDLGAGVHELTFSSSLGTASIIVALGAENIKVDMYDPGSFRSSVSATLGSVGVALQLLGEQAIDATGNAQNNRLVGNLAANVLDGGGGADQMEGGAGNDTYKVNVTGDKVIEKAGEGTDLVSSSVTFTLAVNIEKLTLTGSGNINGTGNSLGNTIVGNGGDNSLNGGVGADRMEGRAGNDTYTVDDVGDTVIEALGQGTDLVKSSVTLTLAGNIEKLTLTGSGDILGTGNTLDNTIVGNAGRNTLKGGVGNDKLSGGTGNDTLVGGSEKDTFIFDDALNGSNNVDRITDFSVVDDTIQLENAVFTALTTTGLLQAAAFFVGSAAHDPTDRIIYNSANGALLYDADGSGGSAGIKFATLGTGLALTSSDFRVA